MEKKRCKIRNYYLVADPDEWTVKLYRNVSEKILQNWYHKLPWSFIPNNEKEWRGFCIDLIRTLSEKMKFDYELVVSKDPDTLEDRNTNKGILRDIFTEKIDIAVAPLTMTAAKAEFVDFVTPYFENSGLSIVIRKPVQKSSWFKFLTVLNKEVWMSIVNTIIVTALAIWLIQKYSPTCKKFSQYGDSRRSFTFRESIWFAITTFTNQGTSEIPFSPPHKVLIAAYWVFVAVMMSTFTANLAAFLTVERLQAPISSFWELTHNPQIKFTVVKNSHAHLYFKNMKTAEDILFDVWKDMALAQSNENESQYRIWDYPIKEEYSHILRAIEMNSPVPNASYGFQKVLENEKGEFALIHEAPEIRYYVYRDCRLIEVGDIFGERPFSIAIKKKSKLQNELKNRILDLHEERYFESLAVKYWNTSHLASCSSDSGDTEIITLDSLGGVFIAVLCGIVLSLITLIIEIVFFNRKRKIGKDKRPRPLRRFNYHNSSKINAIEETKKTKLLRKYAKRFITKKQNIIR